ncbi:MAG: 5'/3'-nucleotidase SurE [Phycisphaerales bacterium]
MNVLLCNDDGIHATGISSLFDALIDHQGHFGSRLADRILPVAPLTVQSATGHGITFRQPLITREVDVNDRMSGIAVDGRPADCVKLALSALWAERFGKGSRPDLVISGMNEGANSGINVLYSGTVAAALEAAFLGVPAIAVSMNKGRGKPRYDLGARFARAAIDAILGPAPHAAALKPHTCLSINIPLVESDMPMPPISVCPMNVHGTVDAYQKNVNPLGETYYWSAGTPMDFHATEPGSDVQELAEGRITITPLRYDLSDHAMLEAWRARVGSR